MQNAVPGRPYLTPWHNCAIAKLKNFFHNHTTKPTKSERKTKHQKHKKHRIHSHVKFAIHAEKIMSYFQKT